MCEAYMVMSVFELNFPKDGAIEASPTIARLKEFIDSLQEICFSSI